MLKKILCIASLTAAAVCIILAVSFAGRAKNGDSRSHMSVMQYDPDNHGKETFVTLKAPYDTGRSGVVCTDGITEVALYPVYDCNGRDSGFTILAFPIGNEEIENVIRKADKELASEKSGYKNAAKRKGVSLKGTVCDAAGLFSSAEQMEEVRSKLMDYAVEEYFIPGNSFLFTVADAEAWDMSRYVIYVDSEGVVGSGSEKKYLTLIVISVFLILTALVLAVLASRDGGGHGMGRGGGSRRNSFRIVTVILLSASLALCSPVTSMAGDFTKTPLEVFEELLPQKSFTYTTLVVDLDGYCDLSGFECQIADERSIYRFTGKSLSGEKFILIGQTGVIATGDDITGTDLFSGMYVTLTYDDLYIGDAQEYLILPTYTTSDFSTYEAESGSAVEKFTAFAAAWKNEKNRTKDRLSALCDQYLKGIRLNTGSVSSGSGYSWTDALSGSGTKDMLSETMISFEYIDGVSGVEYDKPVDVKEYQYIFAKGGTYRTFIDSSYILRNAGSLSDAVFKTPVCAFRYDETVDENGTMFWAVCYYSLTGDDKNYKGKSVKSAGAASLWEGDLKTLFGTQIPEAKLSTEEYERLVAEGMDPVEADDIATNGDLLETAVFDTIDKRDEIRKDISDDSDMINPANIPIVNADPLALATKDVLSDLTDDSVNRELKGFAASSYSLAVTIATAAMAISFISGLIIIGIYGIRVKKAVATNLLLKAGILLIIVGFVNLAGLVLPSIINFTADTGTPDTSVSVTYRETEAYRSESYASDGGSSATEGPGTASAGGSENIIESGSYSGCWVQDSSGNWRVRCSDGSYLTDAWFCDDSDGSRDTWYLLDESGYMVTSPFVFDSYGNFYSIETAHNGRYGMMRYKNGTYDGIKMKFETGHNGAFGSIKNEDAIDALYNKYGEPYYVDITESVYASQI